MPDPGLSQAAAMPAGFEALRDDDIGTVCFE
jgi:hypothetical protein